MSIQQRFKKPPVSAVAFTGPRLLSPKAAAVYIGVSVDLLYEMLRDRKFPFVPKGSGKRKMYLIDRFDLDKWIEASKVREVA